MIEKIHDVTGVGSVGAAKQKRGYAYDDGAVSPQDGLAVSSFAREMAKISDEMSRIPEVREEKVNAIKEQVEAGTYQPDMNALAARLVWAGITKTEA